MEERIRQYLMSKNYEKGGDFEGMGCLLYIWAFAFILAALAVMYVIKNH